MKPSGAELLSMLRVRHGIPASRDAAARPPRMALRRVFDGASLPIFQIAGIKKAHLSALFLACVAKSRLV